MISACGPEPRWSNPILAGRGFKAAVLHGLAKLEGGPDQILAGLGVPTNLLDNRPVTVLGRALEYFGFVSTEAGRPRVNGRRVREYGLGVEKIAEVLWLAQRHNLRRRGFTVPPIEAIDPKSKVILLAVDPSRGPNSVMDEIEQYIADLAA